MKRTRRVVIMGAGGRDFRVVDEHDVDRLGRVLDVEDRVARPIDARHPVALEAHFLEQHARQAVHDVAFDGVAQAFRVDDQAAVVRDGEFLRPDAAGLALDFHLGNHRHQRAAPLRIGNAAAGHDVARFRPLRSGTRLPVRFFGG